MLPARPGPAGRPFSLFLANLLLSVTGLSLIVYALAGAAVMDEVVGATAGFYGPEHEAVAATEVFGWGAVALVALLGLLFQLLAALNHRGSRGARAWSFVLGFLTLCCCAPGAVISQSVAADADPFFYQRMTDALPVWYEPLTSVSGVVGVGALLLALVLLMVPPTNRYFRYFRPQPHAPYYYYPYPYYYGYPPRR